jgi:hypothetical protein
VQRGNGPIQFKEETTVIDFQEESTKYTAALTTIWDGDNSGLHLSIRTESTPKVFQVSVIADLSVSHAGFQKILRFKFSNI